MRFFSLFLLTFILIACEKESTSLDTSDFSMRIESQIVSDSDQSEFLVGLEDYSNGRPGPLTLPTKINLSDGDTLVLTVNDSDSYPMSRKEAGVYSTTVPTHLPGTYGVQLQRAQGVNALNGKIDLFSGISIVEPNTGQTYANGDNVVVEWLFTGNPSFEETRNWGPHSKIELVKCTDANGHVVYTPDGTRIPASPLPTISIEDSTIAASAAKFLNNAVGKKNLEDNPSINSCEIKIDLFLENFHTETSSYSQSSAMIDSSLAQQYWYIQVRSNPVNIVVYR